MRPETVEYRSPQAYAPPKPVARPPEVDVEAVYRLVESERAAVDVLIKQRLASNVVLINQLGDYIVNSGGKRLRPVLLLLSANAFGYTGPHHITLAAVVEFIHTATLLHDDVVDASEMRRGRDTVNALWGNEAAVLVGDFLYSRAFQMMVEPSNMRILEILADATNTIAEGEVMQLLNCGEPDTTEDSYLQVIRCKTAKLFEASTRIGAVLCGRPRAEEEDIARYGMHLGTAFQLVDDVLDYGAADAAQIGKNIGDDLAEGKPTLPLIYAMRHGTPAEVAVVREAIQKGGREYIEPVMKAIETTGALEYTARAARAEAEMALSAITGLPPSPYKDALRLLAEFAVQRRY